MTHTSELALDNQLRFSLYRASRAATRAYHPLLRDLGLTYPQYLTMLVRWEYDRPCGMHEIVQRLGLDSGTLTPVYRRLEQAGYLTRKRDTTDERKLLLTLTDKGRDLQPEAGSIPGEMKRLHQVPGLDPVSLKHTLDLLAASLTED